jgi:predicted SnoaL-like aldol condensation-catalyzing enzyme
MMIRSLLVVLAMLLCACGSAAPQSIAPTATDVAAHPDPLAALHSSDPALAANKRLVFDLWRNVVNAGQVEMAEVLLEEGYIQHSPVLRTGRKAFKEIFSAVPRRDVPELVEPPLVAIVAEGNLVVMALRETIPARDGLPAYTSTHFNLFRVANGRLAEHWHSVQTAPGPDVPLPSEGGPQPVTGVVGAAQRTMLDSADAALAANKRLVFDMWREIVDAGVATSGRYFGTGFVDYSVLAGAGPDGFNARFNGRAPTAPEQGIRAPVVAIVAEADLVVLVTMREHPHPSRTGVTYTTTWFDMFRIADGRIVGHWDAALRATPGSNR